MEGEAHNEYQRQIGDSNLPIPDPTRLTTQLVDRALAAFREVVETRLAAMDKATALVASELDKINDDSLGVHSHMVEDRDRQLAALREFLMERIDKVSEVSHERFAAVDTQFRDRDIRTAQAEVERQKSLDAALAAAKEAVSEQNKANSQAIAKSELATEKRMDGLVALLTTSARATDDKIVDLKARLDRGEAGNQATAVSRTERRLDLGQALLAGSVLIAGLGLILLAVTQVLP